MKLLLSIALFGIICSVNGQIQSASSGNWDNTNTWVGGMVPTASDDVHIVSGHSITLGSDVEITNIILENGSLSIGPNTLTIYGIVAGAAKDNMSSSTNSQLQIVGHDSVPQFVFPAQVTVLRKLSLNRKSGAQSFHDIDLDKAVPHDGVVLELIHGVLYMEDDAVLKLNSKFIQREIPCSDSSYVDGYVQRNIPRNSGIYLFPVGNMGICRPFGVGISSGNHDNINQVRFTYDKPINSENVDYSKLPGGIIQYFYWEHTVVSGANPQRRLYYSEQDFPGVSSEQRTNSMTLANTNGTSKWDRATTGWTVNDDMNYVEFDNANASNSTYWTLGSILGDISYEQIDLPIELLFFDAQITAHAVLLEWETASESNNHFFTIERSKYGDFFYPLLVIEGQGNSRVNQTYSYLDTEPYSGLSYYRLKQTDFNGDYSYSAIVEVMFLQQAFVQMLRKQNSLVCSFVSEVPDEIVIRMFSLDGTLLAYTSDIISANTEYSVAFDISSYENTFVILYIQANSVSKVITYYTGIYY